MKRKFLTVLALLLAVTVAQAQDLKIGYTNIDAIVFSMPEIPAINADLKTYKDQLDSQAATKRSSYETKLQAFQAMVQQPNADQVLLKEKENELVNMQNEFQSFAAQAEQAMRTKEATMLNPIYEKVGNAIEEVRKENGFAMIINSQTAAGLPIVIAAPEEANVTKLVFDKLGVPMPEAPEGDAAKAGEGN